MIIESINCPNIHFGLFREIESNNYNLMNFTVILVGDEETDAAEISAYADKLLEAGCTDFMFCGKHAEEWHTLFDLQSIAFFNNTDDVAMTSTIGSIEEMPDEFCICHDNVFIYADTYESVQKCHKAITDAGCGVKVKYIGPDNPLCFDKEKEYVVLSVEKGWYRVMTDIMEDYLLPPEMVDIIEADIEIQNIREYE